MINCDLTSYQITSSFVNANNEFEKILDFEIDSVNHKFIIFFKSKKLLSQ